MPLFLLVAALALATDQLIKYFISAHLVLGQSLPVWPGVFYITYIKNPGGAFSILKHHTWLFIILGVILVLAVLAIQFFYRSADWRVTAALALLTGGVLGNMIDRLRFGSVTDYLYFTFWPVFNAADICICVGTAGLFLLLFVIKGDDRQ